LPISEERRSRLNKMMRGRYIFTPTKHNYNNNLKNIMFWTSFGEEERKWTNKVGSIGMFEIEWKTSIIIFWLNF
jgi:hypothetical protein